MIKLTDIRKAYNQGRANEFWALNGIDLKIEAQRVTALCGPSGCSICTWCCRLCKCAEIWRSLKVAKIKVQGARQEPLLV